MPGQVLAEFPSIASLRRRTVKGPVNPLDKSTIVSIYPKEIVEINPTIFPGKFIIPAGSYEFPQTLTVGPSSWWKEIDEEQPLLEIPCSSIMVADSIVNDYCNTMIGAVPKVSTAGVFFIPGEIGLAKIRGEYKPLLDRALDMQRRWYAYLVKIADALWARSNGNPLAVPDEARLAVRELGLEREWTKDFHIVEMIRCVACGSLKDPRFPVCGHCKAITDTERATALGLKFAQ